MARIYVFLILCGVLTTGVVQSRTCISTGNGNWGNASSWMCDGLPSIPAGGDNVLVMQGHQINVDDANTTVGGTSPIFLHIYGTLHFENGAKISLPCNSGVAVHGPSGLVSGTGSGSSNRISICGTFVWSTGDGNLEPGQSLGNGSAPSPLPVTLIKFEATSSPGRVDLSWTTASELNNSHFTVLRSTNGKHFDAVARISGSGNSVSVRNYRYTDYYNGDGSVYYRLEQTDFDGTTELSELISVRLAGAGNETSLYPNPVSSQSGNIIISGSRIEEGTVVSVIDMNGKELRSYNSGNSPATKTIELSLGNIIPGRYIVRVINGKELKQIPLVVIR